jgi:hypothetical protein
MKALFCAQRSEEWFAARRGLPTCSRFDAILTAVKGEPSKAQEKLINELIAESILPPEQGAVNRYVSAEMEEGIKLEAEARCCYELEHATEPVTEAGFLLADSGLYGGSPDALVGESGGVEIKCPNAATHIGYVRAGRLPDDYKCQVHGSLIVSGREWWDFFSYCRHLPPFRVRVVRDSFTAKLEAELLNFCAKYNEARIVFGLKPIGGQNND